MTDGMMNLRALAEKAPDADILRDMIAFAAERLVGAKIGAPASASGPPTGSPKRNAIATGTFETRAGLVELRIPKLRKGSYFPRPRRHQGGRRQADAHQACRRHPPRTERRMGGPARPIQDPGNHGDPKR